jgi:hypothetical protein
LRDTGFSAGIYASAEPEGYPYLYLLKGYGFSAGTVKPESLPIPVPTVTACRFFLIMLKCSMLLKELELAVGPVWSETEKRQRDSK